MGDTEPDCCDKGVELPLAGETVVVVEVARILIGLPTKLQEATL